MDNVIGRMEWGGLGDLDLPSCCTGGRIQVATETIWIIVSGSRTGLNLSYTFSVQASAHAYL